MNKRITIDIPIEYIKTLSIEAIEQETKVKLLIEQIVIKATKVIIKQNENRSL